MSFFLKILAILGVAKATSNTIGEKKTKNYILVHRIL